MSEKQASLPPLVMFIIIVALLGTAANCYAYPKWSVWKQGLIGEGELRRAEHQKKILIEQAKAEVEAAEYRAKAIEAIGEAARQYPEYRLQEFIGAFADALANGDIEKIIYVPTEANIPIVEAGRIGLDVKN